MVIMAAVYSVIDEDEGEAKRRLAEICAAFDLMPRWGGKAIQSPGTGRWQAQAVPRTVPTWAPEPAES